MLLIVLLGTLYPMILDGLGLGKISVGAPYFNETLYPFLLLFLTFMALGIQLKWRKDVLNTLNYGLQIIFALLIAYLTQVWGYGYFNLKTTLALSLAYWVVLSVLWSLFVRLWSSPWWWSNGIARSKCSP